MIVYTHEIVSQWKKFIIDKNLYLNISVGDENILISFIFISNTNNLFQENFF